MEMQAATDGILREQPVHLDAVKCVSFRLLEAIR